MFYTDDPIRDFERYDREQARQLEQLPKCECGRTIFDYDTICEECRETQWREEIDL